MFIYINFKSCIKRNDMNNDKHGYHHYTRSSNLPIHIWYHFDKTYSLIIDNFKTLKKKLIN